MSMTSPHTPSRFVSMLACTSVVLLLACGASPPRGAASPAVADVQSTWVDSVLRTMSLREKAAQMVWPNLVGDYVPADAEQWRRLSSFVANDRVGGLLISVGSPTEIAVKLNHLQHLAPLPLLISADLENGAGMRARGGYFVPNAIDLGGATLFATQMALGATRDTALAYAQGRITAIEGRALGIQLDFAPVLDVNNNPANPVINTRSFSEDPLLTAIMGAAFIRGLQDNGMLGTGKHFPGHGDTGVNSHLALPTVTASRARIDSVELVPFRAAIKAGVRAIMSFHGAMPALDSSGAPGTLSPTVLTGLLRGSLGFNGLIISDAMDMRGVLVQFGAREATKRAVAAGIDVLIQPADVTEAITAVVEGVSEGRYTADRVTESARRILQAKYDLGLVQNRMANIDSIRYRVGDSNHVAVARTIAERSITLVKDSLSQIPARLPKTARILSITIARRTDLAAGVAFNGELRRTFPTVRAEFAASEDAGVNLGRLEQLVDSADLVVVGSYVGQSWDALTANAPQQFADFIARIARKGGRVVVVAFGNPYLLQQIPSVPGYMVAWSGFPVSQQAAARALTGAAPITGRLPISIPPLIQMGAGLERR
jgi:beta-N-acetylhexosaminidase